MSRLVKGVSRQVIVVKAPDPRFFEQAIFILKEDAFGRGVTADDVLQEARRVADGLKITEIIISNDIVSCVFHSGYFV